MKRVFFVALVVVYLSVALAQPSGARWTLHQQSGATYVYLPSEQSTAYRLSAIAIRCHGKHAYEMFVMFPERLSNNPVDVTWRFASKTPDSGTWNVSTTGTAVFVPDSLLRDFRHQLTVYDLVVQVTDDAGSVHVLKFNSGGGGNLGLLLGHLPCVTGH